MKIIKKSKLDFNVWKITFINIRITFSPKNYRKWVKSSFKENWNINNWNLKTLVNVIPFIFGFSNMIWSRYQDQTIQYIFGISIPGTQKLKDEISWETFEFIKSKEIDIKNIKQIDIYNDSCIIQFKNSYQDSIVGLILPISDENKPQIGFNVFQINYNNEHNFFNKKNNAIKAINLISNTLYYLDELPLKLDEINRNDFSKDNQLIFNSKLENFLVNYKIENTNLSFYKKTNPKKLNFFKNLETSNTSYKINGILLKNKNINIIKKQPVLTKKNISFIEKKALFQHELDSLFYLHGILPNIFIQNYSLKKKHYSFNKKDNYTFMDHCSNETINLLTDFLNFKNTNLISPRKISGYSYPDLSREKVSILNFHFLLKTNNNKDFLKTDFPTNFIPKIKDNSLRSSNCCGPLVISDRKDSFLGNNLKQDGFFETIKESELDWRACISKEIGKRQNTKSLEDFNDFDPKSWFLSFKQKDKVKLTSFEESFFNSFFKNILTSKELEKNNSFFKNIDNIKFKYHFIPISESFINEKIPNTIKFGDLYKRTPVLSTLLNTKKSLSEKTTFHFYESWEPISSTSWMILTQFSIAIFLIQLLKDLYKDYGKELVEYTLQFANSSGIDIEELKEQYLYDDPGYRLIRKVQKSFKDIAGIDNILPELGEVVWFLRNSGRSSKFKNSIPNGILLTGPPGTGKTLLVQAIAGEAQVPIIVESGSLLSDPQQKGRGIERLKKIFNQARQLAPCIIFIDEVDTLGEKRQHIIQTAMGGDELIESIYENNSINKIDDTTRGTDGFLPKPLNLNENINIEKDLEYQLFRGEPENQLNLANEQVQKNIEAKKTKLSLLTQFLVEMDGLKERHGVIVIGATNRPNVLDPALIRPGRFDKILNLELPGHKKRIEILKLYAKKIQIEKNISWDYLAKRTKGFSAADLAAAMNESTIQSILSKTNHTIETIERGIDLVTSYNFDSSISSRKKLPKDPFFLSRLAYYQAGKAVLQSLIQNHPPLVVLHLWPRPKNTRHSRLYQNSFRETNNRLSLEAQLIGFYAGKASEMIALYGNKVSYSLKRWHSDFGIEDLLSATFLANLLVDKWYFYSIQILIRKTNQILNNRNEKVFIDAEKLELSKMIDNEIEDELEVEKIAKLSRNGYYQQHGFGPWWQIQVAKQTSEIESFFADWYRIYLPDPEETILNLEWIPPDEYHHSNNSLKKLSDKSNISYNDLYKIERDYIFHGLTLNSFNKAFCSLEDKREFLDYFADFLLRFNIIREPNISILLKNQINLNVKYENSINQKDLQTYQILENFWGIQSRRKKYRFLNNQTLNFIRKYSNYKSPFLNFIEKK